MSRPDLPDDESGWEKKGIREHIGTSEEHVDDLFVHGDYAVERDADGTYEAYVIVGGTPIKVNGGMTTFREAVEFLRGSLASKELVDDHECKEKGPVEPEHPKSDNMEKGRRPMSSMRAMMAEAHAMENWQDVVRQDELRKAEIAKSTTHPYNPKAVGRNIHPNVSLPSSEELKQDSFYDKSKNISRVISEIQGEEGGLPVAIPETNSPKYSPDSDVGKYYTKFPSGEDRSVQERMTSDKNLWDSGERQWDEYVDTLPDIKDRAKVARRVLPHKDFKYLQRPMEEILRDVQQDFQQEEVDRVQKELGDELYDTGPIGASPNPNTLGTHDEMDNVLHQKDERVISDSNLEHHKTSPIRENVEALRRESVEKMKGATAERETKKKNAEIKELRKKGIDDREPEVQEQSKLKQAKDENKPINEDYHGKGSSTGVINRNGRGGMSKKKQLAAGAVPQNRTRGIYLSYGDPDSVIEAEGHRDSRGAYNKWFNTHLSQIIEEWNKWAEETEKLYHNGNQVYPRFDSPNRLSMAALDILYPFAYKLKNGETPNNVGNTPVMGEMLGGFYNPATQKLVGENYTVLRNTRDVESGDNRNLQITDPSLGKGKFLGVDALDYDGIEEAARNPNNYNYKAARAILRKELDSYLAGYSDPNGEYRPYSENPVEDDGKKGPTRQRIEYLRSILDGDPEDSAQPTGDIEGITDGYFNNLGSNVRDLARMDNDQIYAIANDPDAKLYRYARAYLYNQAHEIAEQNGGYQQLDRLWNDIQSNSDTSYEELDPDIQHYFEIRQALKELEPLENYRSESEVLKDAGVWESQGDWNKGIEEDAARISEQIALYEETLEDLEAERDAQEMIFQALQETLAKVPEDKKDWKIKSALQRVSQIDDKIVNTKGEIARLKREMNVVDAKRAGRPHGGKINGRWVIKNSPYAPGTDISHGPVNKFDPNKEPAAILLQTFNKWNDEINDAVDLDDKERLAKEGYKAIQNLIGHDFDVEQVIRARKVARLVDSLKAQIDEKKQEMGYSITPADKKEALAKEIESLQEKGSKILQYLYGEKITKPGEGQTYGDMFDSKYSGFGTGGMEGLIPTFTLGQTADGYFTKTSRPLSRIIDLADAQTRLTRKKEAEEAAKLKNKSRRLAEQAKSPAKPIPEEEYARAEKFARPFLDSTSKWNLSDSEYNSLWGNNMVKKKQEFNPQTASAALDNLEKERGFISTVAQAMGAKPKNLPLVKRMLLNAIADGMFTNRNAEVNTDEGVKYNVGTPIWNITPSKDSYNNNMFHALFTDRGYGQNLSDLGKQLYNNPLNDNPDYTFKSRGKNMEKEQHLGGMSFSELLKARMDEAHADDGQRGFCVNGPQGWRVVNLHPDGTEPTWPVVVKDAETGKNFVTAKNNAYND